MLTFSFSNMFSLTGELNIPKIWSQYYSKCLEKGFKYPQVVFLLWLYFCTYNEFWPIKRLLSQIEPGIVLIRDNQEIVWIYHRIDYRNGLL